MWDNIGTVHNAVADYTFDELRVSLSWKATVPPTSSPGGRADLGLDELSTEAAVATMTSALEERGLWDRGPGALDDQQVLAYDVAHAAAATGRWRRARLATRSRSTRANG